MISYFIKITEFDHYEGQNVCVFDFRSLIIQTVKFHVLEMSHVMNFKIIKDRTFVFLIRNVEIKIS